MNERKGRIMGLNIYLSIQLVFSPKPHVTYRAINYAPPPPPPPTTTTITTPTT